MQVWQITPVAGREQVTCHHAVIATAAGVLQVTEFQVSLVEDNTQAGQSYMEFLCAVHQKIQNSVS